MKNQLLKLMKNNSTSTLITCMKGLSCLDALKASISWSIFLILPGVKVTVDITGEGKLIGKFENSPEETQSDEWARPTGLSEKNWYW